MKLKSYTDYAIRTLIYLGINSNRKCTVKEVSESFNISYNHMVKVVHHLSQEGYVLSTKGKGGGITLSRKPDEINIGQVIRNIEADFNIVECFNPSCDQCAITVVCKLKTVLASAYQAFMLELETYSLQDIIANDSELREILMINRSKNV